MVSAMERLRRITTVWSWLPAFRAVAETEHLPTASSVLHVSASALSRTIRLLEEDLGQPLFVRLGRRIELNDAGSRLLASVRDAMRLVHDGVQTLQTTHHQGPLLLASTSPMLEPTVLRGALTLRTRDPLTRLEIGSCAARDLGSKLLRGQIDIVFSTHRHHDPDIERADAGTLHRAVYVASDHPWATTPNISESAFSKQPFAAITSSYDDGPVDDGWPAHLPRNTAVIVGSNGAAVQACISAGLAVVLPTDFAQALPELTMLPKPVIEPAPVFAHHRKALVDRDRVASLITTIRGLHPEPPSQLPKP